MPIEIKELHIKITVDEGKSSTGSSSSTAGQQAIISQCVEQVMEVLESKKER
ncbi:DUF5908 family protein [Echinicola vietnamensis]|uniref:Uncharacterized protein n=1 Tax=Echinicola vietnamensis (strain DSM 17526 / LMG 23754 / KMM 6221) TaxID=926556 RepID=L0G4Q0_ECHVK|nr:DUF5908 family protein [Echinicola vietnamensis]AGA79810.1 hypothetical protein Echvi_3594 [Echinicola vietnamensis DSM 17526]